MKEQAHTLALAFFRSYGKLETISYEADVALWEEIDHIAEATGVHRVEVRAEVISHYTRLSERVEIPKVAAGIRPDVPISIVQGKQPTMKNQKTALLLATVALVLGSMGVVKAGKAFKSATSSQSAALTEAVAAAQGK